MKTPGFIPIAFLASSVLSIETIPFSSPITASVESNKRAYDILQLLRKRAGNCPGGYSSCDGTDNPEVCCRTDSICTKDNANHVACCPSGASCTGTLTGSNSGSFQFPSTSEATRTTSNEPTITGSTMSGAYPFIYVPTSFADADVCSSYYDRCQSDYTRCITQLGGGYGVTVTGGGADLTQGGGNGGAVETCSSLSQSACHGLNLGVCGNYQGGSDGSASRRTSSLHDLIVGMVIGVAGFFI